MDTMVLIGCPVCGRRYRYDTARFGTRGIRLRCRSCEAVMKIDLTAQAPPPPASPVGALPGGAGEADVPPPAPETAPGPSPSPPPMAAPPEASPAPGTGGALEAEAERRLEETFGPAPAPRPGALVADRDAGMRRILAGVLTQRGYQVLEAADGLEARRALAAPGLEVAFLNAYLPRVLGVTLCAEIKQHPELAPIQVVLVGSLYRRDRFVRDPHELYGADVFLDGNGSEEEVRGRALTVCDGLRREPDPGPPETVDPRSELVRLARIVAGDIILYNGRIAEQEIAAGRFFETFAQEVREGEALVAHRFAHLQDHRDLYLDTVREAVQHHGQAAGIPAQAGH